ncbi:hypothetical protein PIB30_086816, partial [Stylosanthes scabra]|nr:hypothetical protein [Stylosanthes scabra]
VLVIWFRAICDELLILNSNEFRTGLGGRIRNLILFPLHSHRHLSSSHSRRRRGLAISYRFFTHSWRPPSLGLPHLSLTRRLSFHQVLLLSLTPSHESPPQRVTASILADSRHCKFAAALCSLSV